MTMDDWYEEKSNKSSSDEQSICSTNNTFPSPRRPLKEIELSMKLPPDFDRLLHAYMAKNTLGLSPASLSLAFIDWILHLSAYPTKQQELLLKANHELIFFLHYLIDSLCKQKSEACIIPKENDQRFNSSLWDEMPFTFYKQGFLLIEEWWEQATSQVHGVSTHHTKVINFFTRQVLDTMSPSNFLLTNPEAIQTTLEEKGNNLIKGGQNFLEDISRFIQNKPPRGSEKFKIGVNLATCKGNVIYRNYLFELIQYEAKTKTVFAEPILIMPAWIMKYYILDLSPENSMVKYLLEKGHTVFMISWKNPDETDACNSLTDYLKDGILKAVNIISEIIPEYKIHAAGYCIGGTILSIIAAYLANQNINALKTVTFFTAQVDFEDAGELLMFIDESELAYLDDLMWDQGYLKKWQLSGAFNMLRSKEWIWSRIVRDYLQGQNENMFDLMAWNTDATRISYKLHSEYLRSLYLNNDLAEHRFKFNEIVIDLNEICVPVFSVSTLEDHIAPWKSVFKLHQLLQTELTFVLTNGGHNAGIISEPGHEGRKFEIKTVFTSEYNLEPEEWRQQADKKTGSWWPTWQNWLKEHSQKKVSARKLGFIKKGHKTMEPAPGIYVHEQ